MGKSTELVYDLMELWRTNSDYSVIQTLEQLNSKDENHFLTDTYEAMLSQKTIHLLYENFRFNLSLEEVILNSRRFATFMLGKSQSLEFTFEANCSQGDIRDVGGEREDSDELYEVRSILQSVAHPTSAAPPKAEVDIVLSSARPRPARIWRNQPPRRR